METPSGSSVLCTPLTRGGTPTTAWPAHSLTSNPLLQHLPQLRELDLSHNAIEAIGPAAFSGLAGGLRLLDLSHNRIRRIPKDALGKLSAKIRLSHNPLHCECALQEALWELKLDPDSVDEIACHTSAQEQFVGKPLIQVLDSGASFCSTHRKTTDVAMLVTMFGWFTMVIAVELCDHVHVYGMVPPDYCR